MTGLFAAIALLGSPSAHAQTTYTWTQTALGTQDWTVVGNWDGSTVFDSGSGNNELRFFIDGGGSSQLAVGTQTITNVPSSLSLNTLTLNGRGPNNPASADLIIGDNTSTWTIGDGTTSTVNLTATFGGGGSDRELRYNVASNLILNQGITTFTGSGNNNSAFGFNFSGNISESAASYGIAKSGNSLLVLSGANSYTGATTVSDGTLRLNSATALSGGIGVSGGTSALTINGGVVELASGNFQRSLGTGSDQFQITSGTSGFSAFGGPRVITVNNDAATELVWGSADFAPSTLLLNASTADSALTFTNKFDLNSSTRNVRVDASTAILSGEIRTSGGTAGLTKSGNGTLVLSGSNTYNGPTTITSGALSVGATNNLGDASAGLVFNGGTLQVTGTALTNISGIGHAVTFNAGKTMGFDIADSANTFTVDQAISGSTLIKSGGGTLVLNEAIFSGQTKISGGGSLVLDYGSGQDTAKLANQRLTLSGGALILRGGTSAEVVNDTVLEIGNTTISREGGSTGTIDLGAIGVGVGETLAIAEGGFAETTNTVGVSGILNKGAITVGSDFAAVDGSNFMVAYSGYTNATLAGGGSLSITNKLEGGGTLTGTITGDALRISNTGNSDILDIQNNDLIVSNGGTILYAGGFDDNYTINGGSSGQVRSNNGNQPLIVNTYVGTLTVNTRLTSGGGSTLTKTGAGTLVVGGSNGYTSNTYVNQGSLRLASDTAAGTTQAGITVQNGAALELSNGITVGTEALAISGTGISNGGALRNFSGTNTYGGAITIGSGGVRINSDSGTSLTLTGGIATSAVQDVTFGGAGDTTVSTTAISGAGNLIKDGAGSLTLTGINTYTGATNVAAGTLVVNGSLADSNTTVNSGATLQGSGSIGGSLTVLNGGTLAAGNSIESLATGALSLEAASTFAYEMDNDAAAGIAGDLTAVTGDLNLFAGALLTLTELGAGSWTDGDKLTLISYDGTWNGGLFDYESTTLADDSTFSFSGTDWEINYDDTDAGTNYTSTGLNYVTITAAAVPEPSTIALLGLGGLALVLRRRRK